MKTAVITVGLGFGDEGKGACVDHLCRRLGADLVVRYGGGSQCGHNVELPDGNVHTFSQFGSGTFAGARTYLGPDVIVNPVALEREAAHLVQLEAIDEADPYAKLSVHPDALVVTPFHRSLNRAKESARGDSRHGSCGQGIGETRCYALIRGEHAIRARDLADRRTLFAKLTRLKLWALEEYREGRMHRDRAAALHMLVAPLAERLHESGSKVPLSPRVPECRTAVFEGAQGVLLDENVGFHPHTTWSDVTQRNARELAAQAGAERVVALGLTRAFTTRHGAGPLPTYDLGLSCRLRDGGNPTNPWQGTIRTGWLDLPLLRYAAAHCGGTLDGLAVSWLDRFGNGLGARGFDRICFDYRYKNPLESPDDFKHPGSPWSTLLRQERIGDALGLVETHTTQVSLSELLGRLDEIAPVVITGFGPTHEARIERQPLQRLLGECVPSP